VRRRALKESLVCFLNGQNLFQRSHVTQRATLKSCSSAGKLAGAAKARKRIMQEILQETLVRQSSWQLALILAFLMLVAWRVGLRMGKILREREHKQRWSKFDDASLALLGLLIAFTFGMSFSHYNERRVMVVRDGNAIGDFYTCASLLNEPIRSKLQALIREYTELRLHASRTVRSRADLEREIGQSQKMQEQMTALVARAVRQGTPIAVPLTNTLNQLISMQAERVGAVENRLPPTIAFLLVISAIIATILVGREQGLEDKPEVPGTLSFVLMVALAVYVTLDLNQSGRGLITISQAPIARALSTMNSPAAKQPSPAASPSAHVQHTAPRRSLGQKAPSTLTRSASQVAFAGRDRQDVAAARAAQLFSRHF
jgi:hypothetical protein